MIQTPLSEARGTRAGERGLAKVGVVESGPATPASGLDLRPWWGHSRQQSYL